LAPIGLSAGRRVLPDACADNAGHEADRWRAGSQGLRAAKDFALANRFYQDLGCSRIWGSEALAAFQIGEFRFLLQHYYVQAGAENCMMHLLVEDTDAWCRPSGCAKPMPA
jgi:hypothetical protein